MAIWQWDLFVVGEGSALPLLSGDGWELPHLPAALTLIAQRILVDSLGHPWLMMDDWIVFGNEQSTRVDLMFYEPDSVEIRIRIDASAVDEELDAICAFAVALRGLFFDPATGSLLQPDRNAVASALASSRAAAFSRSPRSFLAGLAKD
jgi:hypothetical protein